jgi:hypothetical protein
VHNLEALPIRDFHRILTLDVDQLVSAGLLNHQLGKIEWWNEPDKTAEVSFLLKPSDVSEILYLYLCYEVMRQGKPEPHEQPIPIEIRRQRIGKRYFFRCHLWCRASRVRKVYRPTTQTLFGCRACHKLTYRSAQRHDKGTDILRRDFDFLSAAVQAGSRKAILLTLHSMCSLGERPQAILKVSGLT